MCRDRVIDAEATNSRTVVRRQQPQPAEAQPATPAPSSPRPPIEREAPALTEAAS